MTSETHRLVVAEENRPEEPAILRHGGDFTWHDLPVLRYKEEGTTFKDITRQVLFEGHSALPAALRYFEIAPQGHSTLERHEHLHVVVIVCGSGQVLLDSTVHEVSTHDVVYIPGGKWHQFRATAGVAFGFLCLVATDRDRPQLPTSADLERLRQDPLVADFIRT